MTVLDTITQSACSLVAHKPYWHCNRRDCVVLVCSDCEATLDVDKVEATDVRGIMWIGEVTIPCQPWPAGTEYEQYALS